MDDMTDEATHVSPSINRYLVAAGSFLLAAKSLDQPVILKDLAIIYCLAEKVRNNPNASTRPRLPSDWQIGEIEKSISDMEFDILCAIGFDADVELPNTHIA